MMGTFDGVIAGIQEPRRGKGLVDHSAGFGTGHRVDLVDEGPVDIKISLVYIDIQIYVYMWIYTYI